MDVQVDMDLDMDLDMAWETTQWQAPEPRIAQPTQADPAHSVRATLCSVCYIFGMGMTGAVVGSIGPSVGLLASAVGVSEEAFSWVWIARGMAFLGGIVTAARALNVFPRHGECQIPSIT